MNISSRSAHSRKSAAIILVTLAIVLVWLGGPLWAHLADAGYRYMGDLPVVNRISTSLLFYGMFAFAAGSSLAAQALSLTVAMETPGVRRTHRMPRTQFAISFVALISFVGLWLTVYRDGLATSFPLWHGIAGPGYVGVLFGLISAALYLRLDNARPAGAGCWPEVDMAETLGAKPSVYVGLPPKATAPGAANG